jgi:hypothetical protein
MRLNDLFTWLGYATAILAILVTLDKIIGKYGYAVPFVADVRAALVRWLSSG